MNLIQKWPIGLSLACLLAMSSCSKEDVQTPSPEMASERSSASMRGIDGTYMPTPVALATTNGPSGNNKFPEFWQRDAASGSNDLVAYPAGTSSLKFLFGDYSKPFVKELPKIPGIIDMRGVLTVTTSSTTGGLLPGGSSAHSYAKTTITNMKPGQKYHIKYYVASALPAQTAQGQTPSFTEKAFVSFKYKGAGQAQSNGNYGITSLTGKNAQWVAQDIYFIAEDTEVDLIFSSSVKHAGHYSYTHLYVDKNSIKKVN